MSKAGKEAIPRLQRPQITQVGTIIIADILAGHQHGNSRWIGYDTCCYNPIRHLVDRNLFNFVVDQFKISLGGGQNGDGKRREGNILYL